MEVLTKRLKGNDLLDVLDLMEELETVNAEIDTEYGLIKIYHRTTTDNANKIISTGIMTAKEDGLFFSTNTNGYNSESYGESIITLLVPIEIIQIDDIFSNEAHVKIEIKGYKMNVLKYLI